MGRDRQKHVVITDDEPDFRRIVRKVAERAGWSVSECADGNELKCYFAANAPPSLLVLDLVMPDVDGIEVLLWLSARKDTVPICITTGGTAVETTLGSAVFLSQKLAVRRTLLKPVLVQELTEVFSETS